MTSGEWRSWDVPITSTLNISTNRISVVVFSVLVHQMCVLDTKKLVTAYSFSFGETSYERPKNVPKWHLQLDVLGTSSGRQFKLFPQSFLGKFYYISWCQVHTRHCRAKISWKFNASYFGPNMVWDVPTKIGPWGDVLGTLCTSWVVNLISELVCFILFLLLHIFYI